MAGLLRRLPFFLGIAMFSALFSVPFIGADELDEAIERVWNEAELTRRVYNRGDLPKRISVVKRDTPPSIDGIMKPGEWDNATMITGLTHVKEIGQSGVTGCYTVVGRSDHSDFRGRVLSRIGINNMADHQSRFWVSYDDDNLYVAHHSPPPPEIEGDTAMIPVMLRRRQTVQDANLDRDDSINIQISSPVYPQGDNYVIQINSLGTTFECIWGGSRGDMPGITLGWNPVVKSSSMLTLDGWIIEAAIPWSELAPYISKPAPGEVLYMNLGRIWKEMMDEGHAWKAFDGFRPMGEVVFAGEQGIVVRLKDTGALARGQAVFEADIKNLYAAERRLIAEVATDSGELYDNREIILLPGQETGYSFRGMIGDLETTAISFTVSDAATGEDIHVTTLPVIRPTAPGLYLYKYRSRDMLNLWTDITYVGTADMRRVSINVNVTNRQTGRRVFRRSYRGFSSYNPVIEIPTEGWAVDDYDIEVVFNAPGMAAHKEVLPYSYPPLPVWLNNRYGFEDIDNDMVPYPWTDMEVEEETIRVWGRDYIFGSNLLPAGATTLGRPILRAPVRMVVETSDGAVLDTSQIEAVSDWKRKDKTGVEVHRVVESSNMLLHNDILAEYDGLVWNNITIEPKEAITVTSIRLEIPVTPEFTDVINNSDYHLRHTGKLGPEGRVSHLRDTWLGNGDGGIQWVRCECGDDGFIIKENSTAVRAVVGGEGATLIINMLDIPTELSSPHKIQFGLISTPVRPKLTRTPFFKRGSTIGGGPWYPRGGPFGDLTFMPAADPGYDYYGGGRKSGRHYITTTATNAGADASGTEDFTHYGDEWVAEKFARPSQRGDGTIIRTTLTSKSWRDYFAWRHWRHQQIYEFKGLYYDGDGTPLLAAREVWRRLYNITLMNQHYAAREANIGVHYSGRPKMAVLGFATYNWDAENFSSIINANQQTYLGIVDPAMFRAQHMGHNFGWPLYFLGQGRISREWVEANGGAEAVYDQITGLGLLHDGEGFCCIMPRIEGKYTQEMRRVSERMSGAIERHNMKHWKYQFLPYWHQDIVQLPDTDMYASLYIARPSLLAATRTAGWAQKRRVLKEYFDIYDHLPPYIKTVFEEDFDDGLAYLEFLDDKAIIVVYNDTGFEGEMRLEVDWQKLGLGAPEELKAENAVHRTGFRLEKGMDEDGKEFERGVFFERTEEYAAIEDGKLVFPITRYNYRMIVLEKR